MTCLQSIKCENMTTMQKLFKLYAVILKLNDCSSSHKPLIIEIEL